MVGGGGEGLDWPRRGAEGQFKGHRVTWKHGGLSQRVECALSFPSCGLMIGANHIPLAPHESCLIKSLKPQDTEIFLATSLKS